MERTHISQLFADMDALGGTTVTVAGWVRSVRDMKNFGFVMLNDGSCFKDLQVVMNRERLANYDEIAATGVGSALVVTGTLALTPDRPQPFELQAEKIVVAGASAPDYPMQKKRQTREFLRTQQHLRSRTNLFRAVFRVRSVAAYAIHRRAPSPAPSTGRRISSATPPTSPSPASSRPRTLRWPLATSTPLAPRSAPRTPTRAVTPPSSGWSSPRWPSATSPATWPASRTCSST